jgi:PST family polysaccharide transporter
MAQTIGPRLPSPAQSGAALTDTVTLDKHLAVGIASTAGAKWSSQILCWASMLLVARLLLPSDFGLVGMAALYLGLVQTFSEFGIGSAVVTLRDLTGDQIAQINTVSVLSGFVGFGVSCGVAYPLGRFFRAPQLPAVILVMSAPFVIGAFRTVPYSLLQRDMRFKLLSIIETVAAIAQAGGTLVLALSGLGYWALVLGNVTGAVVSTGLNAAWCPQGFAAPRLRTIRHALGFGLHVLAARLCWYGYSNADFLVAGRVLGAAPLGAYTFAWNLATMPIVRVTDLVTRVTPAFFSAVQEEHAALRRYLKGLTEGLSLITFPIAIGLGLLAPEFVNVVLGKKWLGVIGPLELLAFYASFRSTASLVPQVLMALRETRFAMWDNLAALVLLPSAFYLGSRWGTAGIAWGWVVAYPFVVVPLFARVFQKIDMPVRNYISALRPAFDGVVAMVVVVGVLKWALPSAWPLYVRFSLEVLAGAAVYSLVMKVFHRDRLRAFMRLAQLVRS